ncbi:AP-2 complex subunit alpha-1 [Syncephalis pseudoplumigaleata]|uniref:AP-2 complex subunit alpha n=1 Tax=Syncephalis pseudoplumigaleata TaxID=1712513 RepID=A0A4P9Z4S3_9FUNG|nr:AP-2 complex subunit alpha-1 [Syncephalis pseudoplumigaleata]|eukprot:RKP26851.1 AP-2 complex subunit alpha-1 [Syncephalis pseudoplumigaleata]
MSMRGLTVFIADIRKCRVRELEEKRINKELANIRAKFKEGKLDGYQRKKYVCKLLYIYILGWDVEFGHTEAVNLICSAKYSEMQIGYLALTLLLTENHEMIRLVVNSLRKDLEDQVEIVNCLALHAIANIGGREMAESLSGDVYRLLIANTSKSFVKKKAALCLLRLFRKHSDVLPAAEWAADILPLMEHPDLGVLISVTSLAMALCQQCPDEYAPCVGRAIYRLHRMVIEKDYPIDYLYYKVPNPWLQVKLLRLLQYYPPSESEDERKMLLRVLQYIIRASQDVPKNQQHSNAQNAVLFEAISLIIHLDADQSLLTEAAHILGNFLGAKETNLRYLGLAAMAHLAAFPDSLAAVKVHLDTILTSLRDKDISVRRRALDLLYSMCDRDNARIIVGELLNYLQVADYNIREEMVLKIAILAEKHAADLSWYVDTILQLIQHAGDHVSDEVWYRVVQIVCNNEDLQEYAARICLRTLSEPICHETALKVGGYILGEFGHLVAEEPNSLPAEQLAILYAKFRIASHPTRALLLNTFFKYANLFPELRDEVASVLRIYTRAIDVELQQRACEYLAILEAGDTELLATICEEMPPFPDRKSALVSRVAREETEDKRTWVLGGWEINRERRETQQQALVLARSMRALENAADLLDLSEDAVVEVPVEEAAVAVSAGREPGAMVLANGRGSAVRANEDGTRTVRLKDDRSFLRLSTQLDGVLFDNPEVCIAIKAEFHPPRGRLAIAYLNRTDIPFQGVKLSVDCEEGLRAQATGLLPVNVAPGEQAQVIYAFRCEQLFSMPPLMHFRYFLGDTWKEHEIRLPISLSRFCEPIHDMTAGDFFSRWKRIGMAVEEANGSGSAACLESQSTFSCVQPVDREHARAAVKGFGFGVLEGVDPNPKNIVGASLVLAGESRIGCLLRLEPNDTQTMFRLTVRTTHAVATEAIADILRPYIEFGSAQEAKLTTK